MTTVEYEIEPQSAVLSPGMRSIWQHLDNRDRAILPALLAHYPIMFPSETTIGQEAGYHRNAVNACLNKLVLVGLLGRVKRLTKDGGKTTSVYSLADLKNPAVTQAIIASLSTYQPPYKSGIPCTVSEANPPINQAYHARFSEVPPPKTVHKHTSNIQTNIQMESAPPQGAVQPAGELEAPKEAEVSTIQTGATSSSLNPLPDLSPTGATVSAIEWFTASPENMDLYLRFGTAAAGKTRQECEASLRPSRFDWLSHKPANELYPFDEQWGPCHHAGYYWQGVCKWRAANGINLTMPQESRLAGEVQKILRSMTSYQSHRYIFNAIHNFELVRFRLGKIGEGMILDETTIGHTLVRAELLHFVSAGDEWLGTEYERMHEVQAQRESACRGIYNN